MPLKYRLNEISKLTGRGVFFDANILIYLFFATGAKSYEQKYASAFKTLLNNKNPLHVDFQVISEVVNSVSRIEHKKYLEAKKYTQEDCSYKKYRNSQDGKKTLGDIYVTIKEQVLNMFHIVSTNIGSKEIEDFLIVDELDFIDKSIALVCAQNNFVLLTNDMDFKNTQLDILTGNPNMF